MNPDDFLSPKTEEDPETEHNEFKQFEVSKQDFRNYLHRVYDLLTESGVEMKFLKTKEQLDKLDKYGANVIAAKRVNGVVFALGIAIDGWAVATDMGLGKDILSSYNGLHDPPESVVGAFLHILRQEIGIVIYTIPADDYERKYVSTERIPAISQFYARNKERLELLCNYIHAPRAGWSTEGAKHSATYEIDKVIIIPIKEGAKPADNVTRLIRTCNFAGKLELAPPVAKNELSELSGTKYIHIESMART